MATVLGFDVGTTSLKGLLVDESGRVRAEASHDYPLQVRRSGWSEQNPEDWWTALQAVARSLAAKVPPGDSIRGVGLSGQMHGAVFLDGFDRILYPAILWNDQRTHLECDEIIALSDGKIVEWTLNPPRTAFTASKILWLRNNEPAIFSQVERVQLPKDYVRYRLTDQHVIDVTDASGTHLLDVRQRQWSQPALEALGIPKSWLGELVESVERSGDVTEAAAALTGIPVGTPVVGGAADQSAAAVGNGVTRSGVTSITIGTSGVAYVQIGDIMVDPTGAFHTFCHAVPGTWQMMAGVLSAGGSFRWYREVVGEVEAQQALLQGSDPFDVIVEAASSVAPGSEGLIFLPYLTGERSPHNDPHARGAWLGLTTRHTRAHLARSVVEGACFALRDLVEQLVALGVLITEIRVAGGGARSDFWLQILADVLRRPLLRTATPDASAYGAALLAMAHVMDMEVAKLAEHWISPTAGAVPDSGAADCYDDYYEVYRALYPATRSSMHRLSEISQ